MENPANLSRTRMTRGMKICEQDKIMENVGNSFAPSQTENARVYRVEVVHGHWVCTCPDFEYRPVDEMVIKAKGGIKMRRAQRQYK
jgi:hypothetical protein